MDCVIPNPSSGNNISDPDATVRVLTVPLTGHGNMFRGGSGLTDSTQGKLLNPQIS